MAHEGYTSINSLEDIKLHIINLMELKIERIRRLAEEIHILEEELKELEHARNKLGIQTKSLEEQKRKFSMDTVIDYIKAHPGCSKDEIMKELDCTLVQLNGLNWHIAKGFIRLVNKQLTYVSDTEWAST